MSVKHVIKTSLRPVVRAAWPVAEALARAETLAARGRVKIRLSETWDAELDRVLETLPPLRNVPHALYRELVQPSEHKKLHALAREEGAPSALISLRCRGAFWEPVAYQCIPGAAAPARDNAALGRALNALGLEVHLPAGMGEGVHELHPQRAWAYEYYCVDLTGDYEAHWRAKKRQYTIRRARKYLADMSRRIDGEGDLDWIVTQWRTQWEGDGENEIIAAPDRIRFWNAVMRAPGATTFQVHTLQLLSGDRRVAGLVFTSEGDTVMLQCGGRDPDFEDAYSAAGVTLAAIDWAAEHGFKKLDIAGGPQKRYWAPVAGQRYGALFRPKVLDALAWARAND